MFAQNLEERGALNKMTIELVSSAETEERNVKKKNLCQKKRLNYRCFQTVTV